MGNKVPTCDTEKTTSSGLSIQHVGCSLAATAPEVCIVVPPTPAESMKLLPLKKKKKGREKGHARLNNTHFLLQMLSMTPLPPLEMVSTRDPSPRLAA